MGRTVTGSFEVVMEGLRSGDAEAAERVHCRFVGRLVTLAYRRLQDRAGMRVDGEDVVQSAFASFFARCGRGEFDLAGWESTWTMLALLTVRKCSQRRRFFRTLRRDARREVGPADALALPDREPTPAEAAAMAETVGDWLRGLKPATREVVDLGLQGLDDAAIADRLRRSERTVRRLRGEAEDDLRTRLRVGLGLSRRRGPIMSRSVSDRELLDRIVARFEAACWRGDPWPEIEDYLPEGGPIRRSAFVELAHVDLELRLKVGHPAEAGAYPARYPSLAGPGLETELASTEQRTRSQLAARPIDCASGGPAKAGEVHLAGGGGPRPVRRRSPGVRRRPRSGRGGEAAACGDVGNDD